MDNAALNPEVAVTSRTAVDQSRLLTSPDPRTEAVADMFDGQWILIGRHGRPALDRSVMINARQYIDWWAAYDAGGLAANQCPPKKLVDAIARSAKIIASPLRRAQETALAAAQGRSFETEPLFVEAALPPPMLPDAIRFRPRFWGVIARASWWLGNHGGQESRQEAEERAKQAAEKAIAEAEAYGSVAILAHGWFNRMMRPELRARGWVCVYDGRDSHWSFRIYHKEDAARQSDKP